MLYFANRDIFCAGHVTEEDLQRVAAATGGTVQTCMNNFIDEVLGSCEVFEERQVGNEWFNIFSGCPSGQTATTVLRGGTDQVLYCYNDLSSLQINHNHTNCVECYLVH